jgi:7-keto-8-aminopelargonate synthetase-like enzyme
MVALLRLEDRVLTRLYTFGKALAALGGACLSSGSLHFLSLTITSDAHQLHYQ